MTTTQSIPRVAFLGAGKLGSILIQALLKSGCLSPDKTWATVQHAAKTSDLASKLGVSVSTNNAEAVAASDIVFLCVKPQGVIEVVREIRSQLTSRHLLISVAASVPTSLIEAEIADGLPVVRAMPNTPCELGYGATAVCRGRFAAPEHVARAIEFFDTVGRTVIVDEKLMDAVTGLSASGPAYIYIIIESLAEAGVKVGLPRETATLLAAQTVLGAAQVVLQTGRHPALLKDAVTTPAGCTVDGILELEEGKLRVTLIKAVVKACERARELAFKG